MRWLRPDGMALLGVMIFAGTYPATRLAVAGGVDPLMNASVRILGAGSLAFLVLWWTRSSSPPWREIPRFALAGAGVGIVFPLSLGYALLSVPASHGAVVMAALPLVTVLYSCWRGHAWPALRFWLGGVVAACLVLVFSLRHSAGHLQDTWINLPDGLLLLAMVGAAVGYVEGARLTTPERPGWQVISWALVSLLPIAAPVAFWCLWHQAHGITWSAWVALGYGTLFSMYLGFFPWYHAMQTIGVARTSQWQYLQPFIAIAYVVVLLSEQVDAVDLGLLCAVVGTIAWTRSRAGTAKYRK